MTTSMVQLIVKIVVSGIFVGLITEIAKRLPTVGGLVAALPVISLLTIFWLLVDGKTSPQIVETIRGVLFGLIPTTLFLLSLGILLSRDVQFGVALLLSAIILVVVWLIVKQIVT